MANFGLDCAEPEAKVAATHTPISLSKSRRGATLKLAKPLVSATASALSPNIRYLHVEVNENSRELHVYGWNKNYARCGGNVLLSLQESGGSNV